jgi:hypothetical protein
MNIPIPRKILLLRNSPGGGDFVPILKTLYLNTVTEVKVDGGHSPLSTYERSGESDWIQKCAEFRPDAVLMCLDFDPNMSPMNNPWKINGQVVTGSWFLKMWEDALGRHPQLDSIPRILVHMRNPQTPFIADRFFRTFNFDADDRQILIALREAIDSNSQKNPCVFISYSSRDRRFVNRLAADLQSRSVAVWLDEAELRVGDSLIDSIRSALDRIDFVVAVVSSHSVKSEWVRKELDIAMNREIEQKRVIVIPVCKTKCELPGFLKGKVYADFSTPSRYRRSLDRLLDRIVTQDGR